MFYVSVLNHIFPSSKHIFITEPSLSVSHVTLKPDNFVLSFLQHNQGKVFSTFLLNHLSPSTCLSVLILHDFGISCINYYEDITADVATLINICTYIVLESL